MNPQRASLLVLVPTIVISLSSCEPFRDNEALPLATGQACETDAVCAAGLLCSREKVCAAVGSPGTLTSGAPCSEDADCQSRFVCNAKGLCSTPRNQDADAVCSSNDDCNGDLVCSSEARCQELGEPGTNQLDTSCQAASDCGLGMTCGTDRLCVVLPTWTPSECSIDTPDGVPGLRFVIPGLNSTTDFFTLPYPNDIRRQQTITDLSGFPGSTNFPTPAELLSQYVSANETPRYGFGLNEAVIFRFDGRVEYDTLEFGGNGANFSFVNITPNTNRYGLPPRSRFYATGGGDRYVCPNWLGIRPSEGSPLAPLTTYAVIFRRGITDVNGVPLEPSEHLSLVLGQSPPTNAIIQQAWAAYAPLRRYLLDQEIPVEDVIGATVFTTGNPTEGVLGAVASVNERPAPSISDLSQCDSGVISPCGGGPGRGCGAAAPGFIELHGRLELPNILIGEPPYQSSGGFVQFRGRRPVVQNTQPTCVSIAVPTGDVPQAGWPIVIFGHDIGGGFRSAIENGLAAMLTSIGWAVIGFDGILHGERYNGSEIPTKADIASALYNLDNPRFLRDQGAQAVTDLHGIVSYLRTAELQLPESRIGFDPNRFVFIGAGYGAEVAMPFIANNPTLSAAILTGFGASMVDMLRLKNTPHPIAAELGLRLADAKMEAMHPALQLFQSWLDSRDPQNYGGLIRTPNDGEPRKHIFYMHDVADQETPKKLVESLLISMRLALVGDPIMELSSVRTADISEEGVLKANVANEATQGAKQYSRSLEDSESTLFSEPTAVQDIKEFLQDLISEGIPSIKP
ncbi:MAG: hypothetical protein VYA30_04655 [Myxococcota bacterium]|nr:hypothetical protein [Myxococcota bacterium]